MDINKYDAAAIVSAARDNGTVSASFIQRRFRMGYANAAKYVDLMEETGICDPPSGSRPRRMRMPDLSPAKAADLMIKKWEESII